MRIKFILKAIYPHHSDLPPPPLIHANIEATGDNPHKSSPVRSQ